MNIISDLIKPHDRQRDFLRAIDTHDYVLYGGAAGGGKMADTCTPVLTPSGFVRLGDISSGDVVFDEHGKPCLVTHAHQITTPPECYRITFDTGDTIDCCADHLWHTFTAADMSAMSKRTPEYREKRRAARASRSAIGSRNGINHTLEHRHHLSAQMTRWNQENRTESLPPPTGSVKTTREIAATVTVRGRSNHAVAVMSAPVNAEHQNLLVDPYVLGAWLGDGSRNAGHITGIDQGIFDEIVRRGYEVTHHADPKSHGILKVRRQLATIGVLSDKHVPNDYLIASPAQRLDLLRGLMDTDGTVNINGTVEFCNTNRKLIDAVRFLACSLGHKVPIAREGRSKLNGVDHGPKWTLKWQAKDCPFVLKRKADKWRPPARRVCDFRYIVSCERIDPKPMRCLTVDSDSHQFLIDHALIPTHNSYIIRWSLVYLLCRWFAEQGLRGVRVGLFCEDYPSLEDRQISKIRMEFPPFLGSLNEKKHDFTLSKQLGEGVISFRNLDDVSKYLSAEFAVVAVDELSRNEVDKFHFLNLRKRWPGIDRPKFIAGTNPGGKGHGWCKRYWLDRNFPPELESVQDQFIYIPAKAIDNPALPRGYYESLKRLPPAMARAYAEGDWNVFAGQCYQEFRIEHHVCTPFPIPSFWPRFGSNDPGYTDPGVWYWHAVDPDGRIYTYREATFSEEACGERIPYSEQAKRIMRMGGEECAYWVTGMDAFNPHPETGKAISDYYRDGGIPNTVKPVYGKNCRAHMAGTLHELLRLQPGPDGKSKPTWQIFDSCRKLIVTLPTLPVDENNVEAFAECSDDHWTQAAGYGLQAWWSGKTGDRPPVDPQSLGAILGHYDPPPADDDYTLFPT